MRTGFLLSPAGRASLIAIAGAALVLPLLLTGLLHGSTVGTVVDLVGRCVALGVVIVLATRRATLPSTSPAGAAREQFAGSVQFSEGLALELARLQRFSRPFALVNIHCEDAAKLRERDGDRAATELLDSAAEVIAGNLRRTDFSAPVDADSFGILLPETDASTAGIVADGLRERLMQTMRARQWPASFSVGVCIFTRPVESVEAAVARADELMARVRRRGRNGMLIETDGVPQRELHPEPA